MEDRPYRFIANPDAPEIFLHVLHEVEVIGSDTRFVPVTLRRHRGGLVGTPPVTLILPNEQVGPAIALTYSRMPSGVIVPAVGHIVRSLLSLH